MNVVFSNAAEADLEEIGDYIARDDPRRALTFVRALRGRALDLASMPRAFSLVLRYEDQGIRRRPYSNYLIFYCVDVDRVRIVRILHGARDYESLLFPE